MFIKKVTFLIMIFLMAFTMQVQEKEIYVFDNSTLTKVQHDLQVAEEKCNLPENL